MSAEKGGVPEAEVVKNRQFIFTMIVKLQPSRGRFSNFALLNSEVTPPIVTKISHDVQAIV